MQTASSAQKQLGFTLIEILVVVGILAFIIAIAVPNIFKSRDKAQRDGCIENLRQLDSALQQWAVQNNKTDADPVAVADLVPYLDKEKNPKCPAGGTYATTVVGANPTCSLSAAGHSF